MEVLQTIEACRQWRHSIGSATMGFVPTMGSLHKGHLSLIRKSLENNEFTAVSIFVNPIQFNSPSDFETYPREMEKDLTLCKSLGVQMIFAPSAQEFYPSHFFTYCEVSKLDKHLCGASRPGHFKGVCTVVLKLLNIVQPTQVHFGKKDFQQARILQQMVSDLNINTTVVLGETVREESGLAMSSRNTRLSEEQRSRARYIFSGLKKAETKFQEGEKQVEKLVEIVKAELVLEQEDKIDYIAIASQAELQPIESQGLIEVPAILAVAVFIGPVRLIDNILL